MQTRVTETVKPLSNPQVVQTYEDVGNFVHQHSHQSTTISRLVLRINPEIEFCIERPPDAILRDSLHFAPPTCCADF
jgi:hypothetical protein